MDLTADAIEQYLRDRLEQRVRVRFNGGDREKGCLKSSTVHQEFRVLRRMLNVAVRKKLLVANPCSGVEFPVAVKGLFRPHYVSWSEQERIESHGPEYLRNVVRIITETGLRVYKELAPIKEGPSGPFKRGCLDPRLKNSERYRRSSLDSIGA